MCFLVSHHEISFKMTAVLCSLLTTDDFSPLSPLPNAWRVLAAVWCAPKFNYYLIDFSCISIFSSLSHSGCPVGVMFVFSFQDFLMESFGVKDVFVCLSSPILPASSPPLECLTAAVWRWAWTGRLCRNKPSRSYKILKRKRCSAAYSPTKGTWFLNGLSLVCVEDHA